MNLKKIVTVTLIVGLVSVGGGYFGYRGYKAARQHRLIKQAQTYLAKSNERKAMLTLERALKYDPKDAEACRLMAQLMERSGSPGALLLRSRVVENNPHSLEDRLALARTATRFRDYSAATNALEGVDAAGRNTAGYHNVAGAVALIVNQFDVAQAHFLEAARLEPTNPAPALNLAVVRLYGTNVGARAEARDALKSIAVTNLELRCQALRELLAEAARRRETNTALTLSKELVQTTNSLFSDRLLRLYVLKGAQDAGFKPSLAAFRSEAATNAGNVYDLGNWEMLNADPEETLKWLTNTNPPTNLPPEVKTNHAVVMLVADCYSVLEKWSDLQGYITNQNWGELDFLRHALKARALRGQGLSGAAKAEWEVTIKAAQNEQQALSMLLQMAVRWGWSTETEEILWSIVNRYPNEKGAFETLSQALYMGGRTRPWMQLLSQGLKRNPTNLGLKNNLAVTALLLEAFELKPHDLARDVYQQAGTNMAYVSTYAFSLYLQKRNDEALKVIQQLKPAELEDSAIAGYYGLILKAAGNAEKAKTYLDLASKGSVVPKGRLLPEEKKLFDRAREGA